MCGCKPENQIRQARGTGSGSGEVPASRRPQLASRIPGPFTCSGRAKASAREPPASCHNCNCSSSTANSHSGTLGLLIMISEAQYRIPQKSCICRALGLVASSQLFPRSCFASQKKKFHTYRMATIKLFIATVVFANCIAFSACFSHIIALPSKGNFHRIRDLNNNRFNVNHLTFPKRDHQRCKFSDFRAQVSRQSDQGELFL